MSVKKEDVVAILVAKKEQKIAAVAAEFDATIGDVNALADVPVEGDAELQAQLDAEKSKSAELAASLQKAHDDFVADEEQDAVDLAASQGQVVSEKDRADKAEAKVAKLKASLQALIDQANEA